MRFLEKIRNAILRFMYGRNGMDQICVAIFAAELVLYIVSVFLPGVACAVIYYICIAGWFYVVFRALSRNLTKRRAENARFLTWWYSVKRKISDVWFRLKDKDHRYYRCKCGTYCRVPKGKGWIIVTCPKCHATMKKKS